jgi:membrane protein YqaA with SNARE-associated domain
MKLSGEEPGTLLNYLITYGALGLFTLALLDAAFLPLPSLTDAMLFVLAASRPEWMLIYAGLVTLGTTIGCIALYKVSERAGYRALARFPADKRARVKEWIDRYDLFTILLANLIPPPFPFKLVVITAGVFRFNFLRFIIAIAVGRAVRSLIEAYIAARYGERAEEIFAQYYPLIALILAALIAVGLIAKLLHHRRKAQSASV